ncbi:hypothetical protein PV-S19_0130 [Pacmanvirus S19]|nr:hypothetical protein PV-S19_0130 [Pacmanvirus S19]
MKQNYHNYNKKYGFKACVEYKSHDGWHYDDVCGGYFSEGEVNNMLNGKKCKRRYGNILTECEITNIDAMPKDLHERITHKAERFGKVTRTFVRKYSSIDKPRVDDFDHAKSYQLCVPFKSTDRSLHRILGKNDEELYSCYKISSQAAADFLQGEKCEKGNYCNIENPWAQKDLLFELVEETEKYGEVTNCEETSVIRAE